MKKNPELLVEEFFEDIRDLDIDENDRVELLERVIEQAQAEINTLEEYESFYEQEL
jgi:hypothetical protein